MDKSAGHWCSFLPNWSWAQADVGELQQIFSSPVQVGLRLAVKKKNIFTVRVVSHWPRLPREPVDAPSLEVFNARLHGTLSNLV